jgi:hypothetical protein
VTGHTQEDGHTKAESPNIPEETVVKGRLQDGLVRVGLVKGINPVKRSQHGDIAKNPSEGNLYL